MNIIYALFSGMAGLVVKLGQLRLSGAKVMGRLAFSLYVLVAGVSNGQEILRDVEKSKAKTQASVDQMRNLATGNALLDLLRFESVRTELKVDQSQKSELNEKFREIQTLRAESHAKRSMMQAGKMDPNDGGFANIIARLAKASDGFFLNLENILDPLQIDRLIGIYCQQDGGMTLVNPLVARRVDLSEDQRKRVVDVIKESSVEKLDFQANDAMKVLLQRRKETESRILEILTTEQKSKFASLMGSRFQLIQVSADKGK